MNQVSKMEKCIKKWKNPFKRSLHMVNSFLKKLLTTMNVSFAFVSNFAREEVGRDLFY